MTFQTPDGTPLSTFAPIEPDGGGLSHDGRFYVGYSNGAVAVVDPETGEARTLDLPDGITPFGVTWAQDNTVVMMALNSGPGDPVTGTIVACDAQSLSCETAGQLDKDSTAILPF